jgi:hypothetical protein
LLIRAVVVSVCIHLVVFGGWKWGKHHIMWNPLALPVLMKIMPHSLQSSILRSLPLLLRAPDAVQKPQPPPLIYVDVDPALTTPQPPAAPKFYSTANTVAANPEQKIPSEQPLIAGTQETMMKTVAPGSRTSALQPTPPVEPKPAGAVTKTAATPESTAAPKPSSTPGDTLAAKPAPTAQDKNGTSDSARGTGTTNQPASQRVRTLAQARELAGAPGAKTRQNGGVNHLATESSVDAAQTVYGDYDRDFIDAVQARWVELLKGRDAEDAGKVVLDFSLHADGRISDMKMQFSDVNGMQSIICQQAVLDPSRYKPWPAQMRAVIKDPREIRFTFYYSN